MPRMRSLPPARIATAYVTWTPSTGIWICDLGEQRAIGKVSRLGGIFETPLGYTRAVYPVKSDEYGSQAVNFGSRSMLCCAGAGVRDSTRPRGCESR